MFVAASNGHTLTRQAVPCAATQLAQAVADAIAADEAHQLNPSVDGMVVKVPIPKYVRACATCAVCPL